MRDSAYITAYISTSQSEQIEFADVMILNKIDLLPAAGGGDGTFSFSSTAASSQTPLTSLSALRALVNKLNPGAKVLLAEHGRVRSSTRAFSRSRRRSKLLGGCRNCAPAATA